MKKYIILVILIIVLGGFYGFNPFTKNSPIKFSDLLSNNGQQLTSGPIEGTFESTTPCSEIKPPLPQILDGTNCEMTIWNITFNTDKTYTLTANYGMSQPNTMGIKNGGTQVKMSGTWTQEPETGIINLTSNSGHQVSFLKITDGLIHLLDNEREMMTGNGGWSYTLNKVNSNLSADNNYFHKNSDKLISGVFEGRTPCQDFLLAFTKSSVNSPEGCQRIKWLITFYPDKVTGKPTKYVFALPDRRESHRGTIEIINGTSTNPDAVVYRLNPDGNGQVIYLLKVNDNNLFFLDDKMNLLVGTKSLSYTLSKTADSYELRKSTLGL
jgi:hypothetical protein